MHPNHHWRCKGIPCTCLFIASREAELGRYYKQISIAFAILIVEVVGGLFSGSFAVLADSTHAALDFAFYLVAVKVATTELRAFNYHRNARRVGAYAHGFAFLLFSAVISFESLQRMGGAIELEPVIMTAGAIAGFVGNGFQVLISYRSRANVTERAINLHNLTDLLSSAVAVCAGVMALLGVQTIIDAFASLFIAVIMAFSGLALLVGPSHHH